MADESNSDVLPKLNDKQQMFVNFYFVYGCNATKAAKAAGYSHPNVQGSRLLANVSIAAHVRVRMNAVAMQADEVLMHLAEIGRADFGDVVDTSGNFDMKEARENGSSRLVKRFRRRTFTTEVSDVSEEEVEMHDRLKALELIGKAHKLFTDKVEHSGTISWEKLMTAEPESDTSDDDGDPFS